MFYDCIMSYLTHYGREGKHSISLAARPWPTYCLSLQRMEWVTSWRCTLLLHWRCLPCREAYIMYVTCIMYTTGCVASVLLCESLQCVVALNDSVWDVTAALLAKKSFPCAYWHISIEHSWKRVAIKLKVCRVTSLKANDPHLSWKEKRTVMIR